MTNIDLNETKLKNKESYPTGISVNIKLLNKQAIIPTRGTPYSAGYDVCSCQSYLIKPGEMTKISTGIAVEIPVDTFIGIFARSGKATKQGLRPANCVGE